MVIKSEKKSKQKFEKSKTQEQEEEQTKEEYHQQNSTRVITKKILIPRNPNARITVVHHHRDVGDDWLPIPKHKHRAFLVDIAALKKARAEGKPINIFMFDKYFQGPGKVYQPKPLANWRELRHELKEKADAKTKANALKRKWKKALSKSKGTAAIAIQKEKEEAELLKESVCE